MKYTIIIFLLCSFTAFSQEAVKDSINQNFIAQICGYNFDDKKVEKPIHLDWVAIDVENIKLINRLYQNALTIEHIIQFFPHFIDGKGNSNSITYDCGYNLKSTLHEVYGGYGHINIDALYFENKILRLRITIDNDAEIINKYLLSNIRFPLECINGKVSSEIIFQKNIESYKIEYGNVLVYSNDSNNKRKSAINYFTDNLEGGTFKEPYYILLGLGSETFDYLRYFIVGKDYKAMEDLLYSPSPTSRLFAAETIIYMQKHYKYKPSKEHKSRINEILTNAKPIKSGIVSCWLNKFGYDYYDVDKNFEEYLLNQ